MNLKGRLLQIAQLVKRNSIVVDIGCDHGLLSIYLIQNNIASFAYASDINILPLESAKANIEKYHLENKIKVVLSDGLSSFENINFDYVIIAGMGGSLIINILDKHFDLIKDKKLILQPNVNDAGLRKYLIKNNLFISNDFLIKENNIIYDIIEVDNSKSEISDYNNVDYLVGKYNLKRNNPLIIEKINILISKYQNILDKISNDNERFLEYKTILNELMVKKNELNENN